jgi:RND family efflux transporter MFP subunit
VDVGDRVRQGQLLAVLEVPEMNADISRGKASVDRSQADVARSQDELRRAESAHEFTHISYNRLANVAKEKQGLVAQQEVDDAHGKDMVAEAQVSAAKSALAVANEQVRVSAAELSRVETMMEYAKVVAPFSGVITKRYADTGSMVQAGTSSSTQVLPLVKLSENSRLRLTLPVPESAVPEIHIGQPVEVRVASLNRSFPARVARFADKVSAGTRTMDTEVDVPNPTLALVPGMYAEVKLTLERHAHALAVPVQAVDIGDDETAGQVTVVTAQNTVFPRPVKLGLQTAKDIEILSGLNEGDKVVMSGRAALKAGEHVTPHDPAKVEQ